MKIIQSYWSMPTTKKENINQHDRNNGGWIDRKYNYMSWTLSCLQFRKYYPQVELITDSLGYDLLINKLELPYTDVVVCLDEINVYHPDLWAIGKLFAYRLQKNPFIHADGDVFIYRKFDESFEKSALVVQNIERGNRVYTEVYGAVEKEFSYIPSALLESKNSDNVFDAINAGIIGGTDIDFFQNYTKEAFAFVNRNLANIEKINIGVFNILFEQALFYGFAKKKSVPINCLLDDIDERFNGLCDFITMGGSKRYLHALGSYKKDKCICDQLAFRLLNDYPDYYFKIINLLRTNQI